MSDYINLQYRCQRGESSLAGANNLLAECHAVLGRLMAENDALRRDKSEPCDGCFMADAEALRKDAERYRWLRRTEDWEYRSSPSDHIVIGSHGGVINNTGEALDDVIDAAMGKGDRG